MPTSLLRCLFPLISYQFFFITFTYWVINNYVVLVDIKFFLLKALALLSLDYTTLLPLLDISPLIPLPTSVKLLHWKPSSHRDYDSSPKSVDTSTWSSNPTPPPPFKTFIHFLIDLIKGKKSVLSVNLYANFFFLLSPSFHL